MTQVDDQFKQDVTQYFELHGTQLRMLEGRIDAILSVLSVLIPEHPNPDVLESKVRQLLESPEIAEARRSLSPAQLQVRQGAAAVALGLLFPTGL